MENPPKVHRLRFPIKSFPCSLLWLDLDPLRCVQPGGWQRCLRARVPEFLLHAKSLYKHVQFYNGSLRGRSRSCVTGMLFRSKEVAGYLTSSSRRRPSQPVAATTSCGFGAPFVELYMSSRCSRSLVPTQQVHRLLESSRSIKGSALGLSTARSDASLCQNIVSRALLLLAPLLQQPLSLVP